MLSHSHEHFHSERDESLARNARLPVPSSSSLEFQTIEGLLRAQVALHGSEPWLTYKCDNGRTMARTYASFHVDVEACRRFLMSTGIRRGDRICTVAHNHYDTVVHYFSAWSMGVAVVPVNLGEDDRRIAYILADSRARLAFVRSEYVSRLKTIVEESSAQTLIVEVDSTGALALLNAPHFTDSAPHEDEIVDGADDALIIYTSGTTGHPKGVVLDQYNLLVDATAIASWHDYGPDQRVMCVLPIHHVNGIVVTLMAPMVAGASVLLMERFHAHSFFDVVREFKVTIASVVPTLLQYLVHQESLSADSVGDTLRHVICGAGPLTCELALNFETRFNTPIIHGYGLSETTCYSSFLPLDDSRDEHYAWMQHHGFPSIGVPLPVNEMQIHSEDGTPQEPGVRGEIVIRGRNVMRHYYRNKDANALAFNHGWFRSGDEGFYLPDDRGRQYFFITGRFKELIIRGGVNISPLEIDEILSSCEGVVSGISVGFENDWYGEEVGALVVRSTDTLTEDDVIRHCRIQLPYAKVPKIVLFAETLPVTSTGKYQRNSVRHLFNSWKSVHFH